MINVVKIWVTKHFCLFDKNSLEKLCSYIEGLVIPRQMEWGKLLQKAIGKQVRFFLSFRIPSLRKTPKQIRQILLINFKKLNKENSSKSFISPPLISHFSYYYFQIAEHDNHTVTLQGEKVSMHFLADYYLRFCVKTLPSNRSIKTNFISESDLLAVISSIDGTNDLEASENIRKLTQAGFFESYHKNHSLFYRFIRNQSSLPKSLISSTIKRFQDYSSFPFDIVAIHAKELARQLTLIEFGNFLSFVFNVETCHNKFLIFLPVFVHFYCEM